MKKKLSEFYPIDEKVITKIWESAIFVFDTNTLLHLYRYSKNTRNDFMQVLQNIKNSLWIPYQVALEFQQNRLNVIRESQKKYKELDAVLGNIEDIIKNSHNYGQYDDVLPIYKRVLKSVKHYANKLERMRKEVSDFDFRNDKILDFITELYENKVGDEQKEEELEEIYKEGKKRYENLIPPGYKDMKEKDTNRHIYGDLIIWKELIKEAKSAKKDIIFITADTKEDWWLKFNGKTISPRSELVKEFSQTNRTILFYTPQNFLKWYKEKQDNNIQDSSINEVGEIQITDQPKLIRYFYGADPLYADDCKECFYLPICHGRCPHQRIQEELGSVERQPCMKDTNCINRYLEKLIENLSE